MTVEIYDPADTADTVAVVDGEKLTKTSYSKGFGADGTSQLEEVYEGTRALLEEFYEEKKADAGGINSANLTISKATGSVTLNYDTDSGDAEPGEGTTPEWNLEIIEVMRPLAAHPYWQTQYVPASGYEISEVFGKADLDLATGQPYTPDPVYGDWIKRYYALRASGVVQYAALGLQLTSSRITSDEALVTSAYTNVGKVVAVADLVPDIIKAAIDAVEQITGYESSAPSSVISEAGSWEWVKRPPQLQMGGNADSTNAKLTEVWWGLDRWSAVLYPGGTWDPGENS